MLNIRLISDKNRLYSLCFSLLSSKSDRLLVGREDIYKNSFYLFISYKDEEIDYIEAIKFIAL